MIFVSEFGAVPQQFTDEHIPESHYSDLKITEKRLLAWSKNCLIICW